VCEVNGCVIEERHKPRMLALGEWRGTAECSDATVRGYHLSSLYSPAGWYSWRQARDDYQKAKASKDPARMKTWVNTVLGLCFAESGEAPPWEALYARREQYERNKVPAGGLVLTAAADIQKDRVEVELRAWGPRLESWSIDHRVFAGDPARLDGDRSPWPELEDMLSESWAHELGGRIAITCLAVDSGHETQTVYNWARRFPTTKVMAVKGTDKGTVLLSVPRRVDVRADGGKVFTKAVQLWMVSSSVAKTEFYGWLRQPRPETPDDVPTGYLHFPESYDEEWFQQLTAEQLVTRFVRGYRQVQWEKTRERNEALDLAVYNRAAAAQIGIDRWDDRRWDSIRKELTRELSDASAPPTTAAVKVTRRKSKYWP
jgi:phage terminase large subunit GpA-like protein